MILVFIGTKMCLIDIYKIPAAVSLGVVVAILVVTMVLSVRTAGGAGGRPASLPREHTGSGS